MACRVFFTHGTARIQHIFAGRRPELQAPWMNPLSEFLGSTLGAKVTEHYWSGRLLGPWNRREVDECADSLREALTGLSETSDTVVILAKSNGAQLVEHALACLDESDVVRSRFTEIRLAAPLRGSAAHASRFGRRYWVTSDADRLFCGSRAVLRRLLPRDDYEDNTQRSVQLGGCTHGDFNRDTSLESVADSTETSLYQLYPQMIAGGRDDWLSAGFTKVED